MSHMEQPTTNRPTMDYPRTSDGKYKYTASDGSPRYHKPVTVPGLVGPDFPFPRRWPSSSASSSGVKTHPPRARAAGTPVPLSTTVRSKLMIAAPSRSCRRLAM